MSEPKELRFLVTGNCLQKANTFVIAKNHRTGKHFIRHTDQYEATKEDMAWQIKAQRGNKQFSGPVYLSVIIYYANILSDLDITLIMDALEDAGAYKNDNQVFLAISEKRHDKLNPRVEIVITQMPEKHSDTLLTELVGGEFRVVDHE